MITGIIITGLGATLFLYLGYRDWQHSKIPSPDAAYIKYSSPELYILSILGILTGLFICLGFKVMLIVLLVLVPIYWLILKLLSPYF